MAVTPFPTSTEITNLQNSNYNPVTNTATNYMVANNESPASSSKMRGFIEGVKQLIAWLRAHSPQLIQEPYMALSLQNGWVNFGGEFQTAVYWRDSNGVVHLEGLIRNGTTTGGTVVFTLPVGYRPAATQIFSVSSSGGTFQIRINSSGQGAVWVVTGNNGHLSLSGIVFRAA